MGFRLAKVCKGLEDTFSYDGVPLHLPSNMSKPLFIKRRRRGFSLIFPSSIFGGLELGRKIHVFFLGNKAIMSPNGRGQPSCLGAGRAQSIPRAY